MFQMVVPLSVCVHEELCEGQRYFNFKGACSVCEKYTFVVLSQWDFRIIC